MTITDIAAPAIVRKRDGREVAFDRSKIVAAVEKCFLSVSGEGEGVPQADPEEIATAVVNLVAARHPDAPTVEQVQDAVEHVLQASGEFASAKHYILYRARHAEQRKVRPVPPEVSEAFDADRSYFPTPIQQFQFYDKYSRFNWEMGRRETWHETVDRTTDFLHELAGDRLDSSVYEDIRRGIIDMQVMPSMRMLSQAGDAARRNNIGIYNCLAGTERFLTYEGVKTLAECAGTVQQVINGEGKWVEAEISAFGVQPLAEITFRPVRRTSIRHRVIATPNHRWITTNRGEVSDLRVGDTVRFVGASISRLLPEAWIAGFGFGDGTIDAAGLAKVRLCGEKDQRWLSIFEMYGHNSICSPPSYNGDKVVIFHKGHFSDWKKLPTSTDPEYLSSWLRGYLAADGHTGDQPGLSSQDAEAVAFVKMIAPLAGYMVTGHNISAVMETNLGVRKAPLHRLTLRSEGEFTVTAVEDLGVEEEVFCATVEDGHDFVLAHGIHTGNCSYFPVSDVDAYAEALLISMAGCGVGYSVESKYVEQFPRVVRQKGGAPLNFVIPDTTEGWAEALRLGMNLWFDGEDVTFDYSDIRPAGSFLKVKGGRASGPEPLRAMLNYVRGKMLSRQGTFLRTIDAHDMMCVVGNAAVSGGTRRTAMLALFDFNDTDMRDCKTGANLNGNEQRWNANNSAVWPDDITQPDAITMMLRMVESNRGEPGIFSRLAANRTKPDRRAEADFGVNPCGEINLRPYEFCNLSQAVARQGDSFMDLHDKVRLATIIGTVQSLATYFPGLRSDWARNCEEERLLGVDISAQMDCSVVQDASILGALQEVVRRTNIEFAGRLSISVSAATTCNKPNGNSSEFVNGSAGIHARWDEFYLRNARVMAGTPIHKVLVDAGVPMSPENGQTRENATTWVIHFPIKAPEGAVLRRGRSAIEQMDYWLMNKQHWTEHNPSCTISYRPDEVIDLMAWVWEHREVLGGISFLPADDAHYDLLPYQSITEEEYKRRVDEFPDIDFSKVYRYEEEDMTTAAQEVACSAGQCEVI